MSDLIDRKAAVTAIQALVKKAKTPFEKNRILDCALAVKSLPDADGWIPCSERLPEDDKEVLATYIVDGNAKKRYVETASYCDYGDGTGSWSSIWDEYKIGRAKFTYIAWMPMPKPWKWEVF